MMVFSLSLKVGWTGREAGMLPWGSHRQWDLRILIASRSELAELWCPDGSVAGALCGRNVRCREGMAQGGLESGDQERTVHLSSRPGVNGASKWGLSLSNWSFQCRRVCPGLDPDNLAAAKNGTAGRSTMACCSSLRE